MTLEEAIQHTIRMFPFAGYMNSNNGKERGVYKSIGKTVVQYLSPGNSILDFGSGPCDKTAILQLMGFHCSAYDDLQDDWHRIPGNQEKILSFARSNGIDFKLANEGPLPFDKNSFDMIMMHDVLEHLHDSPRDLLNDLLEIAKPNGLLFITVPNAVNIRKRIDVLFGKTNLAGFDGYYWYPGQWRGHIREYVRNDFVQLSEYLNLEVLELRGCDHMLEKLPRTFHPFYLFVTSIFQGWKDSWLFVARKKPDWMPKKTLPQSELNKIIAKNTSYDYSN